MWFAASFHHFTKFADDTRQSWKAPVVLWFGTRKLQLNRQQRETTSLLSHIPSVWICSRGSRTCQRPATCSTVCLLWETWKASGGPSKSFASSVRLRKVLKQRRRRRRCAIFGYSFICKLYIIFYWAHQANQENLLMLTRPPRRN